MPIRDNGGPNFPKLENPTKRHGSENLIRSQEILKNSEFTVWVSLCFFLFLLFIYFRWIVQIVRTLLRRLWQPYRCRVGTRHTYVGYPQSHVPSTVLFLFLLNPTRALFLCFFFWWISFLFIYSIFIFIKVWPREQSHPPAVWPLRRTDPGDSDMWPLHLYLLLNFGEQITNHYQNMTQ